MLGRAAHIDIDDRGARIFRDPRALRHPVRLASGELHDVDVDPGALGAQARVAAAFDELWGGHHLGYDEARHPGAPQAVGTVRP